jgi:hypothetical protein
MFRSTLSRAVPAVAVLSLAALSLAGCNTQTTTCTTNSCHVKVSVDGGGAETARVFDTDLSVSNVSASSVTVTMSGNRQSFSAGQSGPVGAYTVKINSLSDGKADLTVTR